MTRPVWFETHKEWYLRVGPSEEGLLPRIFSMTGREDHEKQMELLDSDPMEILPGPALSDPAILRDK